MSYTVNVELVPGILQRDWTFNPSTSTKMLVGGRRRPSRRAVSASCGCLEPFVFQSPQIDAHVCRRAVRRGLQQSHRDADIALRRPIAVVLHDPAVTDRVGAGAQRLAAASRSRPAAPPESSRVRAAFSSSVAFGQAIGGHHRIEGRRVRVGQLGQRRRDRLERQARGRRAPPSRRRCCSSTSRVRRP